MSDLKGKYKTDLIAACMTRGYSEDYVRKMFFELGLSDEEYVLKTIERVLPLVR